MNDVVIKAETAAAMRQYVAAVEPVLTKQAALDTAMPVAVDTLVALGHVLPDARGVKLAEFRDHPERLIAALTKAAQARAAARTLGQGTDRGKSAAGNKKSDADIAYESALLS